MVPAFQFYQIFCNKFQILLLQANVDIRWLRFEEQKSKTLKMVYNFGNTDHTNQTTFF